MAALQEKITFLICGFISFLALALFFVVSVTQFVLNVRSAYDVDCIVICCLRNAHIAYMCFTQKYARDQPCTQWWTKLHLSTFR